MNKFYEQLESILDKHVERKSNAFRYMYDLVDDVEMVLKDMVNEDKLGEKSRLRCFFEIILRVQRYASDNQPLVENTGGGVINPKITVNSPEKFWNC